MQMMSFCCSRAWGCPARSSVAPPLDCGSHSKAPSLAGPQVPFPHFLLHLLGLSDSLFLTWAGSSSKQPYFFSEQVPLSTAIPAILSRLTTQQFMWAFPQVCIPRTELLLTFLCLWKSYPCLYYHWQCVRGSVSSNTTTQSINLSNLWWRKMMFDGLKAACYSSVGWQAFLKHSSYRNYVGFVLGSLQLSQFLQFLYNQHTINIMVLVHDPLLRWLSG